MKFSDIVSHESFGPLSLEEKNNVIGSFYDRNPDAFTPDDRIIGSAVVKNLHETARETPLRAEFKKEELGLIGKFQSDLAADQSEEGRLRAIASFTAGSRGINKGLNERLQKEDERTSKVRSRISEKLIDPQEDDSFAKKLETGLNFFADEVVSAFTGKKSVQDLDNELDELTAEELRRDGVKGAGAVQALIGKERADIKAEKGDIFQNRNGVVGANPIHLLTLTDEELDSSLTELGVAEAEKDRFKKRAPKIKAESRARVIKYIQDNRPGVTDIIGPQTTRDQVEIEEKGDDISDERLREILKRRKDKNEILKSLELGGSNIKGSLDSTASGVLAAILPEDLAKGVAKASGERGAERALGEELLDPSRGASFTGKLIGVAPDILFGAGGAKLGAKAVTGLFRVRSTAVNAGKIQAASRAGASIAGGATQGFQTFDQALGAGKSKEEAGVLGLKSALITAIIEGLGSGAGVDALQSKFATNAGRDQVRKSITEYMGAIAKGANNDGLEELSDTLVQAIFVQSEISPDLTIDEVVNDAIESYFLGAAIGGGATALSGRGGDSNIGDSAPESDLELSPQEVIERFNEEQEQPPSTLPEVAEDAGGVDLTKGTVAEQEAALRNLPKSIEDASIGTIDEAIQERDALREEDESGILNDNEQELLNDLEEFTKDPAGQTANDPAKRDEKTDPKEASPEAPDGRGDKQEGSLETLQPIEVENAPIEGNEGVDAERGGDANLGGVTSDEAGSAEVVGGEGQAVSESDQGAGDGESGSSNAGQVDSPSPAPNLEEVGFDSEVLEASRNLKGSKSKTRVPRRLRVSAEDVAQSLGESGGTGLNTNKVTDGVLISAIDAEGGMEAKTSYQKRTGKSSGGEYDGAGSYGPKVNKFIFSGNRSPDQMAQMLYEADLISSPDPDTMWNAIDNELKSRSRNSSQISERAKTIAKETNQKTDFDIQTKTPKEGETRVTPDQLAEAEEIVVDGETLVVSEVYTDGDGKISRILLEDGSRFNFIEVDGSDVLYVEELALENEPDFQASVDEGKRQSGPSFTEEGGDLLDSAGLDSGFALAQESSVEGKIEGKDSRTDAEKDADSGQGTLYGGFFAADPQLIIDTAKSIYKGAKTLARFTRELVKKLGEAIRPIAKRLFQDLKETAGQLTIDFLERTGAIRYVVPNDGPNVRDDGGSDDDGGDGELARPPYDSISRLDQNINKAGVEGDFTPKEVEAMSEVMGYMSESMETWRGRAMAYLRGMAKKSDGDNLDIRSGVQLAYNDLMAKMQKGELLTEAEIVATAFVMKQLSGKGAVAEVQLVDMAAELRKVGTDLGRRIKSFHFIQLLTPEGKTRALAKGVAGKRKKSKNKTKGKSKDIEGEVSDIQTDLELETDEPTQEQDDAEKTVDDLFQEIADAKSQFWSDTPDLTDKEKSERSELAQFLLDTNRHSTGKDVFQNKKEFMDRGESLGGNPEVLTQLWNAIINGNSKSKSNTKIRKALAEVQSASMKVDKLIDDIAQTFSDTHNLKDKKKKGETFLGKARKHSNGQDLFPSRDSFSQQAKKSGLTESQTTKLWNVISAGNATTKTHNKVKKAIADEVARKKNVENRVGKLTDKLASIVSDTPALQQAQKKVDALTDFMTKVSKFARGESTFTDKADMMAQAKGLGVTDSQATQLWNASSVSNTNAFKIKAQKELEAQTKKSEQRVIRAAEGLLDSPNRPNAKRDQDTDSKRIKRFLNEPNYSTALLIDDLVKSGMDRGHATWLAEMALDKKERAREAAEAEAKEAFEKKVAEALAFKAKKILKEANDRVQKIIEGLLDGPNRSNAKAKAESSPSDKKLVDRFIKEDQYTPDLLIIDLIQDGVSEGHAKFIAEVAGNKKRIAKEKRDQEAKDKFISDGEKAEAAQNRKDYSKDLRNLLPKEKSAPKDANPFTRIARGERDGEKVTQAEIAAYQKEKGYTDTQVGTLLQISRELASEKEAGARSKKRQDFIIKKVRDGLKRKKGFTDKELKFYNQIIADLVRGNPLETTLERFENEVDLDPELQAGITEYLKNIQDLSGVFQIEMMDQLEKVIESSLGIGKQTTLGDRFAAAILTINSIYRAGSSLISAGGKMVGILMRQGILMVRDQSFNITETNLAVQGIFSGKTRWAIRQQMEALWFSLPTNVEDEFYGSKDTMRNDFFRAFDVAFAPRDGKTKKRERAKAFVDMAYLSSFVNYKLMGSIDTFVRAPIVEAEALTSMYNRRIEELRDGGMKKREAMKKAQQEVFKAREDLSVKELQEHIEKATEEFVEFSGGRKPTSLKDKARVKNRAIELQQELIFDPSDLIDANQSIDELAMIGKPPGAYGKLSDFLVTVRNGIDSVTGEKGPNLGKFVIPFTNILPNSIRLSADVAGWGLVWGQFSPLLTPNQQRSAQLRGLAGLALYATVKGLTEAFDDPEEEVFFDVHGAGPSSKTDRDKLKETGWAPFSLEIKLFGKSRFLRAGPTVGAFSIGILGTFRDGDKYDNGVNSDGNKLPEKDFGEIAQMYGYRLSAMMTELGGLRQLQPTLGTGPFTSSSNFGSGLANSLLRPVLSTAVPMSGNVGYFQGLFDPNVYDFSDPRTQLERYPLLREFVDARVKRDYKGDPLQRSLVNRAFGAVVSSEQDFRDPLEKHLNENGIYRKGFVKGKNGTSLGDLGQIKEITEAAIKANGGVAIMTATQDEKFQEKWRKTEQNILLANEEKIRAANPEDKKKLVEKATTAARIIEKIRMHSRGKADLDEADKRESLELELPKPKKKTRRRRNRSTR